MTATQPHRACDATARPSYTFAFKLYASPTSTVPLWTETKRIVIPTNRLLQHVLGSVNRTGMKALDLSQQLYIRVEKTQPLPKLILVSRDPLPAAPASFWSDQAGDADSLDGAHGVSFAGATHTHGGTDITTEVPFGVLPTGTGAAQVAVGNHGHAGTLAQVFYGTVTAGSSATIEIPSWLPFTLSLGSGWPDHGGVAFLQGMENDRYVAATFMAYNGNGTSSTGGAECAESGTGALLTFGNGSYIYSVTCPGEATGVHNLNLTATGVELRWSLSY